MNSISADDLNNIPITKCVLYARVSDRKQVEEGSGLQSQIQRCRDFASIKSWSIQNIFLDEGISGGVLERDGMEDLLAFLREDATPDDPIAVIFDDISRLARGTRVHEELRDAIYDANGVLFSLTQRFGKDADSRMTEMVQATVAQHFREKNAETTRNRISARWAQGYYTANPPVGYKYKAVKGRGKMCKHRIKTLAGDRVTVEMSAYDLTMGRITFRHKPGGTSPASPKKRNVYRPRGRR